MRKLWLLVLIAVIAAACGGDDGDDTTGSEPNGSGGTTEQPANADPDAVLRYGAPFQLSKTFDPHKASLGQDNEWLFPVYDRLVHQSPSGEPEPGLAERWEFNDDGTVLTLHLRENVTFHDGEPFDADAVKANIERGQTLTDSGVKAELATIAEVRVVDPLTVELVLNTADAGLPLKLSDRAGAMISPAAFQGDDSALATTAVGAGMFTLEEYVPGDRAVFKAYENYWDKDAVKVGGLEIIAMVDPSARFNALASGEIDATILAAADVDAAKSEGLKVETEGSLEVYYIGLNAKRTPELGNVKVRQAIMRAIDREGLVKSLLFGLGEPTVQMFPEGYWAHDPNTTLDDWGYDEDAARALLSEAGVDSFSFELVVPGPEAVPHAEGVAAQLDKIGIKVSLRQLEPSQAAQVYTFDKASDAIIGPWSGRPDPSQTIGLLYLPNGSLNVNGGSTPEIEQLAAEGSSTLEQSERAKVYQRLSGEMTKSALYIPLYNRHRAFATSENVHGLVPYLSGKLEFRNVSISD